MQNLCTKQRGGLYFEGKRVAFGEPGQRSAPTTLIYDTLQVCAPQNIPAGGSRCRHSPWALPHWEPVTLLRGGGGAVDEGHPQLPHHSSAVQGEARKRLVPGSDRGLARADMAAERLNLALTPRQEPQSCSLLFWGEKQKNTTEGMVSKEHQITPFRPASAALPPASCHYCSAGGATLVPGPCCHHRCQGQGDTAPAQGTPVPPVPTAWQPAPEDVFFWE